MKHTDIARKKLARGLAFFIALLLAQVPFTAQGSSAMKSEVDFQQYFAYSYYSFVEAGLFEDVSVEAMLKITPFISYEADGNTNEDEIIKYFKDANSMFYCTVITDSKTGAVNGVIGTLKNYTDQKIEPADISYSTLMFYSVFSAVYAVEDTPFPSDKGMGVYMRLRDDLIDGEAEYTDDRFSFAYRQTEEAHYISIKKIEISNPEPGN